MTGRRAGQRSHGGRPGSFLYRLLLAAVVWIILTGGELRTWPLAIAIVVLTAVVSTAFIPPGSFRLDPAGTLRFLPFFLRYSILGGFDVARRALRRAPGLDPGTIEFPVSLPDGPARTFFAAVLGLLPGTLTARQYEDHIDVHVLDRRVDLHPQLQQLEERVADLFGVPRHPDRRRGPRSPLDVPGWSG